MMREPLPVAVERDAVQLHSVVDEAKAKLFRDPFLQRLEFFVDEFDNGTRLDVDQVIVMLVGCRFVTGATVSEFVPRKNPGFFEQANGAVDGCDRNFRIDRGGALVQCLDVGMIFGFGKDPGDDPPLLRNPKTFVGAKRLDVDDCVAHEMKLRIASPPVKALGYFFPERVRRRFVPRPMDFARVRRCSA